MAKESKIRDYLAEHLSLLEPGLELVGTEVPLKTPVGAGGFVDILARDTIGNRVVIEVKRSDMSARQALHELYKYVAILQVELGIPNHKLRCVLVSTDWHELAVPFSEFLRTSAYQAQGKRISVDSSGAILSMQDFVPLRAPEELSLYREHEIHLFAAREQRDSAVTSLLRALEAAGAETAFILSLDCAAPKPGLMYPFAAYVVVARIVSEVFDDLKAKAIEVGDLEGDATLDEVRHIVVQSLSLRCQELDSVGPDDLEIGYPEKYLAIRRDGWELSRVARFSHSSLGANLAEAEVDTLVGGSEGQNQVVYLRMSSPRLKEHWRDFAEKAALALSGNETWDSDFRRLVDLSSGQLAAEAVSVSVFNPLNLSQWLVRLAVDGDRRFVPELQFIAKTGAREVALAVGFIEHYRHASVSSVEELIIGLASDPRDYLMQQSFGLAWQHDGVLLDRLGLRYTTVLFRIRPNDEHDVNMLSTNRGEPRQALSHNLTHPEGWQRYLREHEALLRSIVEAFQILLGPRFEDSDG
jgi:hypothetical protein